MTGRDDEPCERSKVLANCRLFNGYTDRLSLGIPVLKDVSTFEEFAVVARPEPRSIFAHCSKQKRHQKLLKKTSISGAVLPEFSLSLSSHCPSGVRGHPAHSHCTRVRDGLSTACPQPVGPYYPSGVRGHYFLPLQYTSVCPVPKAQVCVNWVHNAPVELPLARSFFARAPPCPVLPRPCPPSPVLTPPPVPPPVGRKAEFCYI
jgi:hypothetical protein